MRRVIFLSIFVIIFSVFWQKEVIRGQVVAAKDEKTAIIIEVDGSVQKTKSHIEKYYPQIEVVQVYEKLFNGLALRGTAKQLSRVRSLDFVEMSHPVMTYQAIGQSFNQFSKILSKFNEDPDYVFPHALNDTKYTGKDIKIGVVDTGVDYTHPDLLRNYKGGYDAVDLDDDPMETTEEGFATSHGTHVAGIIAANGNLKGVAPDAAIYGYRALGPGGSGSSIQVIAAMEQAVKDGVDIMNLSLGNTVNGPDYPTSIAVNRAAELGVLVVIANGNDGPNRWTIGAPATATKAIGVGAATHVHDQPYLYETLLKKRIEFYPLQRSVKWNVTKTSEVIQLTEGITDVRDKLVLIKRGSKPLMEMIQFANDGGAKAVLLFDEKEDVIRAALPDTHKIDIPVVSIRKLDGKLLEKHKNQSLYLDVRSEKRDITTANFSSRGPVMMNWQIKPDVLAPGTNIVSSVPGGYEALQGTSMAAPHIAGVAALIKEAHPEWTMKQIVGSIQTTASRIESRIGSEPISQGAGLVQPKDAIETKTVIHNSLLSFGKIEKLITKQTLKIQVENMTNSKQTYRFDIPKKQLGLFWQLPRTFTVSPNGTKEIEITLNFLQKHLPKGLHQGWLKLQREDHEMYELPYMFINETADYPRAMGFGFTVKPFERNKYHYELYLADDVTSAEVHLLNRDTLIRETTLLKLKQVEKGMNKGELSKKDVPAPGDYIAQITVYLKNGQLKTFETMIRIV